MTRKAAVTYTTESAFHALGLPDADDLVMRAVATYTGPDRKRPAAGGRMKRSDRRRSLRSC